MHQKFDDQAKVRVRINSHQERYFMGEMINFETNPSQYRHWRVEYDGDVAQLFMDVDENGVCE